MSRSDILHSHAMQADNEIASIKRALRSTMVVLSFSYAVLIGIPLGMLVLIVWRFSNGDTHGVIAGCAYMIVAIIISYLTLRIVRKDVELYRHKFAELRIRLRLLETLKKLDQIHMG